MADVVTRTLWAFFAFSVFTGNSLVCIIACTVKVVNAMHLWGEPELLTDVIIHCDAFITGENELLM